MELKLVMKRITPINKNNNCNRSNKPKSYNNNNKRYDFKIKFNSSFVNNPQRIINNVKQCNSITCITHLYPVNENKVAFCSSALALEQYKKKYPHTIFVYSLCLNKVINNFVFHTFPITKVIQLETNRNYIVTASQDKLIAVHDIIQNIKGIYILKGHKGCVNDIKELPNLNELISCSTDKSLRIWSLTSYTCIRMIIEYNNISSIAYSSKHKCIICSVVEKGISFYNEQLSNKQSLSLIDDIDSQPSLSSIVALNTPTSNILIHNDYIFIGTNTLFIINIQTKHIEHIEYPTTLLHETINTSTIRFIYTLPHDDTILTITSNGVITIWDYITKSILLLMHHPSTNNILSSTYNSHFNNNNLLLSSNNSIYKLI
jgi:WD40 repeat protein